MVRDDPLPAVRRVQRDRTPGCHTAAEQTAGDACRQVVELGVGQGAGGGDEGGLRGAAGGRDREDLTGSVHVASPRADRSREGCAATRVPTLARPVQSATGPVGGLRPGAGRPRTRSRSDGTRPGPCRRGCPGGRPPTSAGRSSTRCAPRPPPWARRTSARRDELAAVGDPAAGLPEQRHVARVAAERGHVRPAPSAGPPVGPGARRCRRPSCRARTGWVRPGAARARPRRVPDPLPRPDGFERRPTQGPTGGRAHGTPRKRRTSPSDVPWTRPVSSRACGPGPAASAGAAEATATVDAQRAAATRVRRRRRRGTREISPNRHRRTERVTDHPAPVADAAADRHYGRRVRNRPVRTEVSRGCRVPDRPRPGPGGRRPAASCWRPG